MIRGEPAAGACFAPGLVAAGVLVPLLVLPPASPGPGAAMPAAALLYAGWLLLGLDVPRHRRPATPT